MTSHNRNIVCSFAWKLRIFPKGSALRYLMQDYRKYKPWRKKPNGWRHTSSRVRAIFCNVKLPHYHKPIFKLLKKKRK